MVYLNSVFLFSEIMPFDALFAMNTRFNGISTLNCIKSSETLEHVTKKKHGEAWLHLFIPHPSFLEPRGFFPGTGGFQKNSPTAGASKFRALRDVRRCSAKGWHQNAQRSRGAEVKFVRKTKMEAGKKVFLLSQWLTF